MGILSRPFNQKLKGTSQMSKNKVKSKKEYWIKQGRRQRIASNLALIYEKRFTLEQAFNRGYLHKGEYDINKRNKLLAKVAELEASKSTEIAFGKMVAITEIENKISEAELTYAGHPIGDLSHLIRAYKYEHSSAKKWLDESVIQQEKLLKLNQVIIKHDQQDIDRLTDLSQMQSKVENTTTMLNHYKAVLKETLKGGK